MAEYFLQHREVVSVHGGDLSLFELGREPGGGDRADVEGVGRATPDEQTGADLPARPAICRACDVLMVSICFSPFSLIFGFTRLLKMIRFMLLRRRADRQAAVIT